MNHSGIILNFHGIGTCPDSIPIAERPYWISEAFFSSIIDLCVHLKDERVIRFTFDDGNKSDISIATPILAKYGIKATFFLLVGRMSDPQYLSRDDCRHLLEHGMRIGLHGRNHVDWRKCTADELYSETVSARKELELEVHQSIQTVAIPFGAYNRRVIKSLIRSQFVNIYTSDGGLEGSGIIRNRNSVRSDMDLVHIENVILGREKPKRKIIRFLSTIIKRNFI